MNLLKYEFTKEIFTRDMQYALEIAQQKTISSQTVEERLQNEPMMQWRNFRAPVMAD